MAVARSETWRLLIDRQLPGARNMAVDHAILKSVSEGKALPTLRLYGWDRPTITIGYFQGVEDEVYLDQCEKDAVDVIRRITGGGAVYHDNEVTYSVAIPLSSAITFGTIVDSYRRIAIPIMHALWDFGLHAEYQPINDITVYDKKISGSAQTRKMGTLLQHGTIMVETDIDSMFNYLRVADEKNAERKIADIKERVATMCSLVAPGIHCDDMYPHIATAIARGFTREYGITFREESLSDYEEELAEQYQERMFANTQWNLNRKAKDI